ncbi:hypothetical protein OIU78_026677 [Salix suchowensis]|nr:hypothetical protein OIU78_026677 [Salix suchowensis]KAJ6290987.1 hypothetical protein OIU78_026677 [Salix suchowensis]
MDPWVTSSSFIIDPSTCSTVYPATTTRHRHHHHNPHTHHQRNPPFSSSTPPDPHHNPSFLCRGGGKDHSPICSLKVGSGVGGTTSVEHRKKVGFRPISVN